MRPLFTIHAGEYLVGEHIERTHRRWNVWIPSKDTGIDLLVTNTKNQKTVSLQVKFSKDFNPTHVPPLLQNRRLAAGWWTHDLKKIQESNADFWIFVLPSFAKKKTNFIILPPAELLRRFRAIHSTDKRRIHSYLRVTEDNRCWEARGLTNADQVHNRVLDANRDFTMYLNVWKPIEEKLK
jgi:hypothetical protein